VGGARARAELKNFVPRGIGRGQGENFLTQGETFTLARAGGKAPSGFELRFGSFFQGLTSYL